MVARILCFFGVHSWKRTNIQYRVGRDRLIPRVLIYTCSGCGKKKDEHI